jgi:hypothetical protein
MNTRRFLLILCFYAVGLSGFVLSPSQSLPELSANEVVDKVHAKIISVPEMENWEASVLATLFDMDKNWKPKKKVIIQKWVTERNGRRTEKIINAPEYDKDKGRDVTAEFQEEAAKFNKKNADNENEAGKRRRGRHRGLDLQWDEFFPFGDKRKKDYEYSLSQDILDNGQNVYILETRSRIKSSDYFEGKYYIHPETFDVFRAELQPAKNPGPLKRLEMQIDFDRLPEGYLVVKSAKVRIHVGLIIKNIRMESEEIYSGYNVFE